MTERISTDYLVVGSGAMGMAFIDTLLDENPEANIILVDRYAKPGGHWNMAYPFVTLHQPSAYYGVNSKELSTGNNDQIGLNQGQADLASRDEILAYYDQLMRHKFLPSGRVQYFPLCDYFGEGRFEHRLSGQAYEVSSKKIVDCTYLKTNIPATHTPDFTIAPDVEFIPINDLPKIKEPPKGFTIIGGGKTGTDAILWLLENQVPPSKIRWVVSRDAWLLDRENTQADPAFFETTIDAQANMFEAIAQSASRGDMYDRLEACGYFLRLDPNVSPAMFHGATISKAELEALRQVKDIVRKGRVVSITAGHLTFVNGRTEPTLGHIVVDCSASAVKDYVEKPIFVGDLITPQTVRAYQPVFSAALTAWIECHIEGEAEKNKLMNIVPLPDTLDTFVRMTSQNMMNQYLWGQNKALRHWMRHARLDGFSKMVSEVDTSETAKVDILNRLKRNAMPAMAKLQSYL